VSNNQDEASLAAARERDRIVCLLREKAAHVPSSGAISIPGVIRRLAREIELSGGGEDFGGQSQFILAAGFRPDASTGRIIHDYLGVSVGNGDPEAVIREVIDTARHQGSTAIKSQIRSALGLD